MGSSLAGLAWRQVTANKALAAALGLGIAVAATLLASAPIYARSMSDLGLTYAVRNELETQPISRVQAFFVPVGTDEGHSLREAIELRTEQRIGWFHERGATLLRLNRFTIVQPGQDGQAFLPLGQPQSMSGYEGHVAVVEGRLPERTGDGVIEVVMSPQAARVARLGVGASFTLADRFDNCEREFPEGMGQAPPSCPNSESVTLGVPARLTGLVTPLDLTDPFWMGTAARFFDPAFIVLENAGATTPMFVNEATLLEDFARRYPAYTAETTWAWTIRDEALDRTSMDRARDDLEGLRAEFATMGAFVASPLEDTLARFERSETFQQTPLAVLLLEITAIAVFYVAIIATMVVERQAGEIALLRGRGATVAQVLGIHAVQGAFFAIPVTALAPLAAGVFTAFLGITPVFDDVTGGSFLPVTIVPSAYLFAGAGAAVSMVAVLVPALVAALRGPMGVRRAMSRPGHSIIQRYYIDLALAGIAAILLVELQQRGSVFQPSPAGGVSSDPLLLASPALAIFAAAMVILRLYPLVVALVARAPLATTAAPVAMALWQAVRNPGQYARLALLLMMAVAIGTFAASYTRTADRSYLDRANHEAGADLRASETSRASGVPAARLKLEATPGELEGVDRVAAVARTTATLATAGRATTPFQVIALDPEAAATMLWFRDDYADAPLDALMARITAPDSLPGIDVPPGTATIRIWARAEDAAGAITLSAGIRDSEGRYGLLELGTLPSTEGLWTPLERSLEPGTMIFNPVEPLSIVSLVFSGSTLRGEAPIVFLDDLAAVGPNGQQTNLEDFEGPSRWTPYPSPGDVADTFDFATQVPHGGNQSARIGFRQGRVEGVRGLYVSGLLTPLPALVSESFLATTGSRQGSTVLMDVGGGAITPFQVAGVVQRFPTTSGEQGPLLVVDRDRLLAWVEMAHYGFTPEPQVNEIWLDLGPGADEEALRDTLADHPYRLTNVVSRAERIDAATSNPLIAASGSGILLAAFLAILVLVGAALLAALLASLRQRRVEFAVIRSMGLTRTQVLTMLAVEYAIVFAIGAATGCALGLVVSDWMLSFLEVTEAGKRVEPPFILETQWGLVAFGIGTLLAVFAFGLGLAGRLVARISQADALRSEQ